MNPIPWPNLQHLWDDPRMTPIKQLKGQQPLKKDIFKAFSETPYDRVEVVIIGQDPYPFPGIANGLAFDCSQSLYHQLQPSLDSIYDACEREGIIFDQRSPSLAHLPPQGVLLLNSALTVAPNTPGSHQELWRFFMNEVVRVLSKKEDLVWILYGGHAKSFKKLINPEHKIFESVHPVADAYGSGEPRFYTWFKETNKYLVEKGKLDILWFDYLPF